MRAEAVDSHSPETSEELILVSCRLGTAHTILKPSACRGFLGLPKRPYHISGPRESHAPPHPQRLCKQLGQPRLGNLDVGCTCVLAHYAGARKFIRRPDFFSLCQAMRCLWPCNPCELHVGPGWCGSDNFLLSYSPRPGHLASSQMCKT